MDILKNTDMKVLYIEDDSLVRESITNILSFILKDVVSVPSAIEALEYVEKNHVDLIITDIRMPKMDGLEFVKILKERNIEIPVIVTTSFNETDYFIKAIELKVEKFIKKPIDVDDLIKSVEKLVQIIYNKKELEQKRIELENYKKAIKLSSFVMVIDTEGNIKEISENLKEFINTNAGVEIEYTNLFEVGNYYDYKDLNQNSKDSVRKEMFKKVYNFEVFSRDIILTIGKKEFTLNMIAFPTRYENKQIQEVSLILKDLTAVVEDKNKTIEKLYTDITTNLPNKHALINRLNKDSKRYTLMLMNIDEYRKIRHTYGLKAADKILIEIAQELKTIWLDEKYPSREVFKVEEDIFALLKDTDDICEQNEFKNMNIPEEEHKKFIIKKISTSLIEHFDSFKIKTDDLPINISTTIGVSSANENDIFHEAIVALDYALNTKRDFISYCEIDQSKDYYKKNIEILQKLKIALKDNKVKTYFQAIVDENKKIKKYEALARVIDPDDESFVMTPYVFLDVIKNSKYYERFTKQIIKEAITGSQLLDSNVAINLSYDDISNPEIIDYLEKALKTSSHTVTLEFLESEGLQDLEKTKRFCLMMKKYGAKIAIDDFGSGYSNYDYILEMPIDILKIDGSLIKKANNYKGYLLLESIVNFAKRIDIEVVAEFVESEEYFNILRGLGIDNYQGYYFDKPKPVEKILNEK